MSEMFNKDQGGHDETATEAITDAPRVRVGAFGADPLPVDFVEGEKVSYYLGQANITAGRRQSITLNGVKASKRTRVTDPNSTIVVSNNVGNG